MLLDFVEALEGSSGAGRRRRAVLVSQCDESMSAWGRPRTEGGQLRSRINLFGYVEPQQRSRTVHRWYLIGNRLDRWPAALLLFKPRCESCGRMFSTRITHGRSCLTDVRGEVTLQVFEIREAIFSIICLAARNLESQRSCTQNPE